MIGCSKIVPMSSSEVSANYNFNEVEGIVRKIESLQSKDSFPCILITFDDGRALICRCCITIDRTPILFKIGEKHIIYIDGYLSIRKVVVCP